MGEGGAAAGVGARAEGISLWLRRLSMGVTLVVANAIKEAAMSTSRVRESQLAIPALQAAAERADGYISTSDLIRELEGYFDPSGEDAELIEGRQDTKFSQKVRNLVSHRGSSTSIFTKGYAEYDAVGEGIMITTAGRAFLDQVPE